MKGVVFDRKTGILGKERLANKKETEKFKSNYVVDILDSINFHRVRTVRANGPDHSWIILPDTDERVRFIKLFEIIYDGDWYFSASGVEIDEYYLENEREVFEQVRKLFVSSCR